MPRSSHKKTPYLSIKNFINEKMNRSIRGQNELERSNKHLKPDNRHVGGKSPPTAHRLHTSIYRLRPPPLPIHGLDQPKVGHGRGRFTCMEATVAKEGFWPGE